ncbi:CTP synthase [Candidatus Phytoplasma melaleucae]|uniref:CTP synthase n=1 Tax=Candidatus Phytoplasma melaleucae TaxID=2982630 RepID=A0ABT9DDC7_9MOLU|nr:CTP synthase ['Melaleuca sp.' phytoplasma]MDO8168050.1 CTP synthase ['Melaleuca sp.' phytoplasma]
MNNQNTKTKFIFITGGVVSGLGKGIIASSIGHILKKRGLKVFIQKFDPYINVDSGTMSPYQHGEVFVTNDGTETDLDLGNYERYLDINLSKDSSITTGQIYQSVINKEREGKYLGKTIQIIPHITDEIKNRILKFNKISDYDIVIVEIGGTIGDMESLPFVESIRQIRHKLGWHNVIYVHNTFIPYLQTSQESKTKPTQHSIKELRSLGIQPQILILRSEKNIPLEMKKKISILCDVQTKAIFENTNVDILYQITINLHKQKIDNFILDYFRINNLPKSNLSEYKYLIHKISHLKNQITVALVGKYVNCHDAYLSILEALKHASYYHNVKIYIKWVDSEILMEDNINDNLKECDGILIPGGFGARAIEGKIKAVTYARENNIPFFGICLGMQTAIIEYARKILKLKKANSIEIDPDTPFPVITKKIKQDNLGGSLRLGLYACQINCNEGASYKIYQKETIYERYRHRYEMNLEYLQLFAKDDNFIITGFNPDNKIPEIIELKNHIWFIGVQFHPEFLSRPLTPHPLFKSFIQKTLEYNKQKI